jgi:pyruvate,water dikinase
VEDAADRSFAGLFESVLAVRTEDEALEAAARCIGSGAAERVLTYAGVHDPLPVGLVVQRLVRAVFAGVVFSRDPLGRDPGILVEAVPGLGENLVSGRLTPETWRLFPGPRPESHRQGPAVIPEDRAWEIARTARRLAQEWRQGLDMEWAIDADGLLWWLQARPITTGASWVPPVVRRSAEGLEPNADGPVLVWSNFNVRESMPDPIHPLSWSLWKTTLVPSVMRAMTGLEEGTPAFRRGSGIDLVNGRLYFNLNAFWASPTLGPFFLRALDHMDARVAVTVRSLAARGVFKPRRNPGARWAVVKSMLKGAFSRKAPLPPTWKPGAWLQALDRCSAEIRARPPLQTLGDVALLDEIRLLGAPETAVIRAGLEAANRSFYVFTLATRLFRPWPRAARLLATGVRGNPTTEISLGLSRLAQSARSLGGELDLETLRADPSAAGWLEELERFLDRFGHRAPREFDLGTVRWVEDPARVLDLVRASLHAEPLEQRLQALADEREIAVEEAIRAAAFWRRPLMRWAARAVLAWMPLREAPKHHALQVFLRARLAALELGRRLLPRGLDRPEDVLFMEIEEIEAIVAGAPVPPVSARRADFQRWSACPGPDFIRSDGVPPPPEPDGPLGALEGQGIGGGVGEGPVNILRTPDPALVSAGDVLVLRFADPGWTPLFPRAAAVVMEVGGIMCHAAVVARELGVPAVFGVRDATRKLRPGERLRVDGDTGRLTRLEASDA